MNIWSIKNDWQLQVVLIELECKIDKEYTKEMIRNAKTVVGVHTHTHTTTFNEIIGKIQGIKFAFICNIKKTENKLEVYFRDNISKNIVLI